MTTTRGIPEVPQQVTRKIVDKDGNTHVVSILTPQHQQFFIAMREQLVQLRSNQAIPDAPTNLRAIGQAFGNTIQFTKSANADYYEVISSPTPNLRAPGNQIVDIGDSAMWVDTIGNQNITKYYWVRARKNTGSSSLQVGPVKATTLASNTGVTPPKPPPPGNLIVTDQTTGNQYAYQLSGPRSINHV